MTIPLTDPFVIPLNPLPPGPALTFIGGYGNVRHLKRGLPIETRSAISQGTAAVIGHAFIFA
jgi:hypothetical protein